MDDQTHEITLTRKQVAALMAALLTYSEMFPKRDIEEIDAIYRQLWNMPWNQEDAS